MTRTPKLRRDPAPPPGMAELAFARIMTAAARAAAAARPAGLAAIRQAIGDALAPLWAQAPPEAARDVMISATGSAIGRGVCELPAALDDGSAAAMVAADLLDMASAAAPAGAAFTPLAAFASSQAFDRDEDAATFGAAVLMLTLACDEE